MDLNELIERLEQLRQEHGGELAVYYMGLLSPVNGASIYQPIDRSMGTVAMLE